MTEDLEQAPETLRLPWWAVAGSLVTTLGIYAYVSVEMGLDANWDWFNYHRYNPWAFLNGRMDHDVAPAQLQTYLNPLVELPAYWLFEAFEPKTAGALLGAFHGLNAWLLGCLGWTWFRFLPTAQRAFLTLTVTVFGALGLEAVNLIGRTTHDNFVSIFVLAALVVLARERSPSLGRWAVAGLILGFGTGLKLTVAIHALAFGILAALAPGAPMERLRRVGAAGGGGFLGVMASSGFWMWEIYSRFQNPFFPFWNGLFRSPYFAPKSVDFYAAIVPGPGEGLWNRLTFPFRFAAEPTLIRAPGMDYRLAACLVATGLFALVVIYRLRRRQAVETRAVGLALFVGISYWAWQELFSYSRMAVALEYLAGFYLAALAFQTFGPGRKTLVGTTIALGLLIYLQVLQPQPRPLWDRGPAAHLQVPEDLPPEAMVVIVDTAPVSYLIPAFPPEYRFVHIFSNIRPIDGTRFEDLLRKTVESHEGPFFAIVRTPENKGKEPEVRDLGYGLQAYDGSDRCHRVDPYYFRMFHLCPAWRISEPKQYLKPNNGNFERGRF